MTRDFFEWKLKWEWIYSAVRDRWGWLDIATVARHSAAAPVRDRQPQAHTFA